MALERSAFVSVEGNRLAVHVPGGYGPVTFGRGEDKALSEFLVAHSITSLACSSSVDELTEEATALRGMLERACAEE